MTSIFRFVSAQAVPLDRKAGLIEGGEIVKGTDFGKALEASNDEERPAVASKYMETPRFVGPGNAALAGLLRVAASFRSRKAIAPEAFEAAVRRELGHPIREVDADAGFKELTQRLAESLLACRVSRSAPTGLRGKLALALKVCSALHAVGSSAPEAATILSRPWAQMVVFRPSAPGRSRAGGTDPVPGTAAPDTEARSEDPALRSSGRALARPGEARAPVRAQLEAIDAALAELDVASAKLPSRLSREGSRDEKVVQGGKSAPPDPVPEAETDGVLSAETRSVLRAAGLSMRTFEDLADVEEKLSTLRARLASGARRSGRQARRTLRGVPGGSIVGPGGLRPGITLPGDLGAADLERDPGTPGAPRTVGSAKVIHGLLMRVEDRILGYEPGAIARIANVPAAATKLSETELTTRTEDVVETTTGETSTQEQSLQTDERFALQQEAEKEVSLEMSAKAAGGFSASYGPVSAEGSAEASTTFGMHSSTSSASDYAKNVVEKAVSSIVKSKQELTRHTRVVDLRDLQREGFDNTGGDSTSAIYQWVDEVHEGRLLNYGSRLMLEFLIPQPGTVLLWSMTGEASQKDLPQPPSPFDIALADIEPGGIDDLVEEYGATDLPPAPPRYRFVSKILKVAPDLTEKTDDRKTYVVSDESLAIPEGYEGDRFWASLTTTRPRDKALNADNRDDLKDGRYALEVGREFYRLRGKRSELFAFGEAGGMVPLTGTVPIGITGTEDRAGTAMIVVRCRRTDALLDEWRIEVYAALQKAYQRKADEYDDKVRMARVRGGLTLAPRNPAQNRAIERDEVKRSAICLLTAQYFDAFGALRRRPPSRLPQIRFDEARTEGEYIQFFESAFEWTQVEYVLYPYFWSNPAADWLDALNLRMDDPLFETFLRAGAARAVVPVRPGFEAAVMTYLSHPEEPVLWDGREYEDIDMDDELYFPVWQAVMENQGQTETAPVQVGSPWRFRIPTNHQILSEDSALPAPP